jgi:hypothetical protein
MSWQEINDTRLAHSRLSGECQINEDDFAAGSRMSKFKSLLRRWCHPIFRRPHQVMNNQMLMEAWRAGTHKIEAAQRAVEMPLRLDNANALPTYPQLKQQEAA